MEIKFPRIWFIKVLCSNNDSQDIKSDIASAFNKLNFPFKKALLVNSPGFAIFIPFIINIWIIFLIINIDPWHEISIKFSLVKELGDLKIDINTSSIIIFFS